MTVHLSFIEAIMGQVQRTLADKTAYAGQKLNEDRAMYYHAGIILHIILSEIQRNTVNHVLFCNHTQFQYHKIM